MVCRATRIGHSRIASRGAEGQRADRNNVQVGRAGRRRPRRTKVAGARENGVCSQVRAAREMGLTEWGQRSMRAPTSSRGRRIVNTRGQLHWGAEQSTQKHGAGCMVNTRYWKIQSRARGDGQHRMSPLGRRRALVGSQVVNDCTGRAPGRFRAMVVGASTDPRENPRQRGEGGRDGVFKGTSQGDSG